MHGLCHFLSIRSFHRERKSFKSFSELLQFIVINIINEFISGGESHTPYRNKWEFSINKNGAHVATRPNASTHSFIGLIVFTTACYSILWISSLCFNSFTFLAHCPGFICSVSYFILDNIYISYCECLLHSPTANRHTEQTHSPVQWAPEMFSVN